MKNKKKKKSVHENHSRIGVLFLKKYIWYLLIYSWLPLAFVAVQVSSVAVSRGYSLVEVLRLLTGVTSLAAERRL